MNNRKTGTEKEEEALSFLTGQGYEILDRNFYTRSGEIDLIGKEGGYLVFIEVKYRSSKKNGVPEASVTPAKQQKIIKAAMYYLYSRSFPTDTPVRFDVLSILGDDYHLIKNAFEASL